MCLNNLLNIQNLLFQWDGVDMEGKGLSVAFSMLFRLYVSLVPVYLVPRCLNSSEDTVTASTVSSIIVFWVFSSYGTAV